MNYDYYGYFKTFNFYLIFSIGIEDGQTIRIVVNKNEIFVTFKVEKSDYFHRDGSDIHTDAKISIAQALLGGSIRIKGLYDDHTVQVMFVNFLIICIVKYQIIYFEISTF